MAGRTKTMPLQSWYRMRTERDMSVDIAKRLLQAWADLEQRHPLVAEQYQHIIQPQRHRLAPIVGAELIREDRTCPLSPTPSSAPLP